MGRKKSILLSLAVIGAMAALITAATSAVFTDTATSDGNTFGTGTLSILLADNDETTPTDPVTASITSTDMAPGDVVYGPISVVNDGSLELRYAMTSTSTNDDSLGLATELDLGVVVLDGAETCDATAFPGDPANTVVLANTTTLDSAGFGSTTPGSQPGDRVLAASASEVLCFRVEFPSGSTGPQGATTTTTFTFTAEQTANNS